MARSSSSASPFGRITAGSLYAAGSYWALQHLDPIMVGGSVQTLPAIIAGLGCISGLIAASETLNLIGRGLSDVQAGRPTGLKGTAGFITSLRQIKHELVRK